MSKPKKVGRPSGFKPEYCEALIDHMTQGLSYETFAATIGLCRATLYVWEKSYPEFLDAKKRGFEACQLWWEREGMKGLFSVKGGALLNTGIWVFNMKNRFKWTDRMQVEAPQPEERDLIEVSDEELDRIIAG